MRWPWSKPKPLPILPYVPPVREVDKPVKKKQSPASWSMSTLSWTRRHMDALRQAQSQTGFHKAWNRLTGKQ